jgi:nitrate reductase gamma subunit
MGVGMHAIYSFVAGPLAWAAFILFFGGIIFRLVQLLVLANKTEKFIFTYMSLKYSLRSIAHWIVPFATVNWRMRPVFTVVTFAFHLCLLFMPVFLLSHMVLWDESWNFSWWSLPDAAADVMTILVMAGCLYFLVRRVTQPEVKFVTDWSDYLLLVIVAAPFMTGFIAYHQLLGIQWMTIVHMLCGEIMLAAIPFTRLVHMVFSPLTRAYMGSEFGKVRHARDW